MLRIAKPWPILLPLLLIACASTLARPALYEKELLDCTADADTLSASLACEERVRARYGRPPLDAGDE